MCGTHPLHPRCVAYALDMSTPAFDISAPDRNIPYSEARDSPYLNACIQEAFRMHPALGVNIERVVPASGDTIAGHYVPGGTIVGCNP